MRPATMTDPREAAAHAEILPMLRDHLVANIRATEKDIERLERKLAEARDKVITLKQIAVAASVPVPSTDEPVTKPTLVESP